MKIRWFKQRTAISLRANRRTLALALILGAVTCFSLAARALRASETSVEVLQTEQTRTTALINGNFDELDRLIADDVTYIHASGMSDTKQTYMAALRSGVLSYQSWVARETHVRLYGDAAVLTGIYSIHAMDHRVSNDPIIIDVHFLTVYARRDGRWQQVAWQSTRVPAPAAAQ